MNQLILSGVRQNNLRNIDLTLPLRRSIVITGPSGSGKSSLAFETIYAEGQRRYMQSLSTYARQFLEKFRAPDADKIQNIPPTIALEQVNPVRNSRATVGTSTEVSDYLRLLFEKVGIEHCDECGVPMERLTHQQIFERIANGYNDRTILIGFLKEFPGERAAVKAILEELLRSGYTRLVLDGNIEQTEQEGLEKKVAGKTVLVALDRIKINTSENVVALQTRITEGISTAMSLGEDEAHVYLEEGKKYKAGKTFTTLSRCPKCKKRSVPRSAIAFSFNSPLGACQTCKGFGNTLEVDEDLVVPNAALSLEDGAIDPFTKPSLKHWQKKLLEFCKREKIDETLPYRELKASEKKLVFEGDKKFKGVRGVFEMMNEEKYKMRIRVFISRYTSPFTCKVCKGGRLNESVLRIKIDGKSIAELSDYTVDEVYQFFKNLSLSNREKEVVSDVLKQLMRRLDYLSTVGLGYLTFSRQTRTLSGGEYQRILLATQLSQGLTDTMYVLDEPSIGLHPKDTQQLIKVLQRLREQGNSLVIVEHDPEIIEWAEQVVDLGPGAGSRGGNIVFTGSREHFLLAETSTAHAVKQWKKDCRDAILKERKPLPDQWLELSGACANNLKKVDIKFPLQRLVAVTGVSGSGKSTLVVDTLYQALSKIFQGRSDKIGKFRSMSGFEYLGAVELVDQSPIGRSSRSNPITFVKGYDEIRTLFAQTREAVQKRLTPGHFSFNVAGGRCEACEGEGRVKVDMVFMEDVYVPCQTCDEKRFKPSILSVRYKGKNIDDVLRMTVDEAYDFYRASSTLRNKLSLMKEVGLGYLQLGQPGFTLSGGEAQRLKIARELSVTSSRKTSTLFILDEPTTGLHFNEISRLIQTLGRLLTAGHSVVVIEHNVQMISAADYLIDLGPDGGSHGGSVVAMGTPLEVANKKLPHTSRYLFEILNENKL